MLYREFRDGALPVLVVSKVANFAVDLPDASLAVQVSGTFGSRQEEAQRLGRILRPKPGANQAHFYSLVSRDTGEQDVRAQAPALPLRAGLRVPHRGRRPACGRVVGGARTAVKLFDVPWPSVLADLPRWERLPLAARRVLLDQLKTTGNVAASALGAQRDAILHSGIARLDAAQRRALVTDDQRALVKVLRAMDRHRLFDAPTPTALQRYLEEHFTNEDVQRLMGGAADGRFYGGRQQLGAAARVRGMDGRPPGRVDR